MQMTFLRNVLPNFSAVVRSFVVFRKRGVHETNEPAACFGHDGLIDECRVQFASPSLKVWKSGADVNCDWMAVESRVLQLLPLRFLGLDDKFREDAYFAHTTSHYCRERVRSVRAFVNF